MDLVGLKEVILWVAYGGAGWVTQKFLGFLSTSIVAQSAFEAVGLKPFGEWQGEFKRYFSFAMDIAVACGAFGLAVALGYAEAPVGLQLWVEKLFVVSFPVFTVQQVTHARDKLR